MPIQIMKLYNIMFYHLYLIYLKKLLVHSYVHMHRVVNKQLFKYYCESNK